MDDFVLVLNAGSSSLKFSVYRRPSGAPWALDLHGQIEGIGTAPQLSARDSADSKVADEKLPSTIRDGRRALESLAAWLRGKYGQAHLLGVGHRVVHGGAQFSKPIIVNKQVLADLTKLIPLAPLHQPCNLAAIEAVFEHMPEVPQVACFDTAFHRGQPAVAELVPLPCEITRNGVQRYGFHGISYEYIASVLPDVAPEIGQGKVLVAHLGSGASLCAFKNGKSMDCSFGFTALDGLCMGTRPGSVDPGVILYLFQGLNLTTTQVEDILYKKSGLLGISGLSNDMRQLLTSNEPRAKLAVDYFVYRAAKEIGALTAALGGIDGLVFTAGIGENSAEIRRRICEASAWLGIEIDVVANQKQGPRISRPGSQVSAWVIPTNEELMIARHTGRLLHLI